MEKIDPELATSPWIFPDEADADEGEDRSAR